MAQQHYGARHLVQTPGTETTYVSDIRLSSPQQFLYYAMLELEHPSDMRNIVNQHQNQSVGLYSYQSDSILTFQRGQKRYELSNHLGNVLAVITDRRIQACGAGDVMYYNAQVVSVSDYYPFGMGIKERGWSAPLNNDTAKYEKVDYTHKTPYPTYSEQLSDGSIKTLTSSWRAGGSSEESYSGECKVQWSDPKQNGNTYSMVSLNYQEYNGDHTSLDNYIYFHHVWNHYRVYSQGTRVTASHVTPQAGDELVIERKEGRLYFYVIRTNGTRADLVDIVEFSPGSPMYLAYVSWTTGDILDIEFSELIKPKGFGYRFSFNGKEQDNEVSGEGNTIAFEARIYDSRLGRFFSRDPREGDYAWQSPYAYFKNSPISTLDILGMGGVDPPKKSLASGDDLGQGQELDLSKSASNENSSLGDDLKWASKKGKKAASLSFNYHAMHDRYLIGGNTSTSFYGDANVEYLNLKSMTTSIARFGKVIDEPSAYWELIYSSEKFSGGLFSNHTKGYLLDWGDDKIKFGAGNRLFGVNVGYSRTDEPVLSIPILTAVSVGGGAQITRLEPHGPNKDQMSISLPHKQQVQGFGFYTNMRFGLQTPKLEKGILHRVSADATYMINVHWSKYKSFDLQRNGQTTRYSGLNYTSLAPAFSINLQWNLRK